MKVGWGWGGGGGWEWGGGLGGGGSWTQRIGFVIFLRRDSNLKKRKEEEKKTNLQDGNSRADRHVEIFRGGLNQMFIVPRNLVGVAGGSGGVGGGSTSLLSLVYSARTRAIDEIVPAPVFSKKIEYMSDIWEKLVFDIREKWGP